MRRFIGHVQLHGKRLNYYVIGNSTLGYGVQITQTYVEKADRIICGNLTEAINLAQELHRCSVFPSNLEEIVEDYQYGNNI